MKAHTRQATTRDISALAEIEIAAALAFDDIDLSPDRKLRALDEDELRRSIEEELTWVATTTDAAIVGFLAATRIEGVLHILEMDVLPEHQGNGIGSMLIEIAVDAAQNLRCQGLSLTTFSHVPWNRPFYERRGFTEVPGQFLPHLSGRLEAQRQSGLRNRMAMYRNVG